VLVVVLVTLITLKPHEPEPEFMGLEPSTLDLACFLLKKLLAVVVAIAN
jgi:hypothetical protein